MKKFTLIFMIIVIPFSAIGKITDFLKKNKTQQTNICENIYCPKPPENITSVTECVNYYLKSWQDAAYTNMYGIILKSARENLIYEKFAKILEKQDLRIGAPLSITLNKMLENDGVKCKWELIIKFPNKKVSDRKVIQNFIFYKGKFRLLKGGLIPVDYENL